MIKHAKELLYKLTGFAQIQRNLDDQKALLGAILAKQLQQRGRIAALAEAEFKVFSQWGDDGIIQYLVQNLDIPHHTFIEFGVEDYTESNTRFLLTHNNWSGLILDGSSENIAKIHAAHFYWKFDLQALSCFVDRENINQLMTQSGFDRDVGLLHIDIDGNDYWVWETIEVISPIIVIIEYNSVFGAERAITVPYREDFNRTKAHFSNLYFGSSLPALILLSERKGYKFIGCNSAGNNAYFVRSDKINDAINVVSLEEGFRESKFRESRNSDGQLNYKRARDKLAALEGLPVVNVETNQIERL